jgi:hypothetical protein
MYFCTQQLTIKKIETMKVTHPTLGEGQVISQDANNVTVDFNGTTKVMIIKFAKLKNEDGSDFGVQAVAAPAKAKKLNKANFINVEDYKKSEYFNMDKNDFEDMRKKDAYKSISW